MYHKKLFLTIFSIFLIASLQNVNSQTKDTKNIDELLGSRLMKVFQSLGNPIDLFCSADGRNETVLEYGKFGFQIGKKIVNIIYYWENYDLPVNGISIGDMKKDAETKLGKPDKEKTSSIDGDLIWIYDQKDKERYFVIFFDENAKVKRIQWELMD